ncbi:unnamed protein product, partial [Didymodactylos carnosus]
SCILPTLPLTSTPITTTTTVPRIQSVGWTNIPSIWIIIPIILGYILILLLAILIALCLQRRRRRRQRLQKPITRYFDNSGVSSRAQLVTPIPVTRHPSNATLHRSGANSSSVGGLGMGIDDSSRTSVARSMNKYRRESRSDFNLHDSQAAGVRNEYFYTEHCPR